MAVHRSLEPISNTSIPGNAAMASALAMPSGVSSMAMSDGRGIALFVDLAKRGLTVALQRAGAADRAFAQRREAASAHKCLGFDRAC